MPSRLIVALLFCAFVQKGSVNPKLLAPPDPAFQLPARDLRVTSSTATEVPSFGFFGAPQCDKDGELFFHLNKGSLNTMEVLKLRFVAGSAEPTVYQAPPTFTGDKSGGFFINWSVTPSGEFWMLGESRARKYFLFKFNSEGTVTGETELAVPEHLDLRDFAVSDQGIVLVSGNFDHDATEGRAGKRYVALLSTFGKVQKEFDLKLDKVDLETMDLHEGAATYGEDGAFYVLGSQQVLVISQSGTIERRLSFDKPKDARAVHLAVSGGYLAIWLYKDNKDGPITTQFLLMDTSTGESLVLYNTTPETGNAGLCYSRKAGFTMWHEEDKRLKLLTANAN
jgi:hypothetical protein